MKAALYTLGCKTNIYDTQAMEEALLSAGYEIVSFHDKADVYIINTCAVTNVSESKSRQMIHRARKTNPDAVIIAAGCYSQIAPQRLLGFEEVDGIIGIADREKLPLLIEASKAKKTDFVTPHDKTEIYEPLHIRAYSEKTRAFLKIQEGCDNYCAYCIIPYARGKARSRNIEEILAEAAVLSAAGHSEIVLTGTHIASYGKEWQNIGLIDVIESLQNIQSVARIRLGSLEPKIFTPSFVSRLQNCSKVCPSFHLSLQSGSENTLVAMGRRYSAREYAQIAEDICTNFPTCSLTTDVIAGFPGESEEDHKESLRFCRDIGFMKIHVFPYSAKKGTKAATMAGQVDKQTKQRRSEEFLRLSSELQQSFYQRFIGKEARVLFEQRKDDCEEGYSENYITVKVRTDVPLCGQIKKVRLLKSDNDAMQAEII